MNGRVYDPLLGRFLSADPTVQFPKSTQGLNRYTYANNNPLSFTDPSGFGFFSSVFRAISRVVSRAVKAVKKTVKVVKAAVKSVPKVAQKALQNQFVQIAGSITASYFGGPFGAAAFSALTTLANGGNLGDALMSAGTVLAFAAVTYGVGEAFGHQVAFLSSAHISKIVAHGVAGGAFSKLRGGKFQSGFLSGAVTAFAAPGVGKIGGKDLGGVLVRTAAAAAVGGASAELGGGKFKNGAIAGAFQRLFNDELEYINKLKNYHVSRPLDSPFGLASHTFVAAGARNLGDPNANIYSYGENDFGNVGLVNEVTRGSSVTTHATDRAFWLGLSGSGADNPDVLFIVPRGLSVDSVAGSLVENQDYSAIAGPFGANSISASQAVTNRASGYRNLVPGRGRVNFGAGSYPEIQFR